MRGDTNADIQKHIKKHSAYDHEKLLTVFSISFNRTHAQKKGNCNINMIASIKYVGTLYISPEIAKDTPIPHKTIKRKRGILLLIL